MEWRDRKGLMEWRDRKNPMEPWRSGKDPFDPFPSLRLSGSFHCVAGSERTSTAGCPGHSLSEEDQEEHLTRSLRGVSVLALPYQTCGLMRPPTL